MRKTTLAVVAGLVLHGGCEHGAPSAAHIPLPAQAPSALSPAARAQLSRSFDLDAMDRLLATLGAEDRALFLASFKDAEWAASGRRDVETRDVSITVWFRDPERQQLLEEVWAPFWSQLPATALSDPSSPLPGRRLAARRQANSLARARKEGEP